MATIRKVSELDVTGKRVFVRVDFNVPQNDKGEITDDTRIRAALPTIRSLVERGARVILGSHLGRPKGKTPSLTLLPVGQRLAELLAPQVPEIKLCDEVVGDGVRKVVGDLRDGEIALLENSTHLCADESGCTNDCHVKTFFHKPLRNFSGVFYRRATHFSSNLPL